MDTPSVEPSRALFGSIDPSGLPTMQSPNVCVIDFEEFASGEELSDLGYGVRVIAEKRRSPRGGLDSAKAILFNTSNPSGNNYQLGTPHSTFAGPGIGKGGKRFAPYENREAKGMALVVSEDDDLNTPDASRFGGVLTFIFSTPSKIGYIGILNLERIVQLEVLKSSGDIISIDSDVGGKNSFQAVDVGAEDVIMIVITMMKSAAVTEIEFSCP
jgi:hypothetical protein